MNILTARAMQLTGVDRVKFNDAIADGHYTTPPEVDGKSRRFGDDDMAGLAAFGRLLELGIKVPLAASWACAVVESFREHRTDLVSFHIVRTFDGRTFLLPFFGADKDEGRIAYDPDWLDKPNGTAALEITIPVANIMADLYRRYRELHQAGHFKDDAAE